LRVLLDDRGIAFDLFPMEGGLYGVALFAVLIAINGEQSFAGETIVAIFLENATIPEITRVLYEDVADVFWAEKQYSGILAEVDGRHVAICALQLLQKTKWVLSQ
jgi:hypothetical protein